MTPRQAEGIEQLARARNVDISSLPLENLTKAEADVVMQRLDRSEVFTFEWLNSLGRQPPVRPFPFHNRLLVIHSNTPSTIPTLGLYLTVHPPSAPQGMVDPERARHRPAT